MNIKTTTLDKKFSLYIRTKAGKCERCRRTGRLECSHFHGRRKQSVRFDPENVEALCFSCHRYFTENPADHRDWFYKRLGKLRYDCLMLRANTPGKPDYKLLNIWLTCELKKMGVKG